MVILNEYESAVFLARDKCRHKNRKHYQKLIPITFVKSDDENYFKVVKNPIYDPYKEGELKQIEKEENIKIYEYLKIKYPNEGFAERFKMECL